jgi:hypothetical protein
MKPDEFTTPSQSEMASIESGSNLDFQHDIDELEEYAKLLGMTLIPINYIQLHNR